VSANIQTGQIIPLVAPYRELLLGCGATRAKKLGFPGQREWRSLTTLDVEPGHKPDVIHDLNVCPWPFDDNSFDEIHAYEVLEHLGSQGDYKSFFAHFMEIWRILKPGGHLFASCPSAQSRWLWGDPGHTRLISAETLAFVIQPEYTKQVGVTAMTDYRSLFTGDFESLRLHDDTNTLQIILKAVKPSRISV
jgi:SAM-dependent methyltransferase